MHFYEAARLENDKKKIMVSLMHDVHQSTRTAYFLYNASPHTRSVLTKCQDTPISIMCQQASNHVSHFPSVWVKLQNPRSAQKMQSSSDFLLTFPANKP